VQTLAVVELAQSIKGRLAIGDLSEDMIAL
jgi:hypothetical protein